MAFLLSGMAVAAMFNSCIAHELDLRRTQQDPFMICNPDISDLLADWPDGYALASYTNPLALCSAANSKQGNAGCLCHMSNGHLDCASGVGDHALLTSWRSYDGQTLIEWCSAHCLCGTQASAAHSVQENSKTEEDNWGDEDFWADMHEDVVPGVRIVAQNAKSEPAQPTAVNKQCGNGNCTGNQDCSAAGSCTCQTTKTTYQPGSSEIFYLAACLVSLGGKRDLSAPCPCNSSYVSHACCQSFDGLVHEEAQFKLGALQNAL